AVRGSAEIEATVQASGASVTFNPRLQLNRPGLLLLNGVLYVAFGSHCDFDAYHGWVFGYDGLTLGRAFVVTPTGGQGAVWQSGDGLSADASASVYMVTGNGTFTADRVNLSNAVVRMVPQGGSLVPVDSFTPYNTDDLTAWDADLGTTAPLLIPGTNLLTIGSKEGRL